MNLNEYIAGAAPNDWSLAKESGSGGTLTLRWRVLHGEQDSHTEAVGTEASGEGFSYRLVNVRREVSAGGGYEVVQTWGDALRELDDVPCFLRQNLPAAARGRTLAAARWGLTCLVAVDDVLAACAAAAGRAGVTLDYSGVNAGDISVPLIDNGGSVGSVLDGVARLVPNWTTRVEGSTVSVCGGEGALVSTATRAQGVVECSPDMKAGTLTVGSTVVDLAAVYAANAASPAPLNWYAHHARLIADALADCAEADAMQQGRFIFLTAREPGAAGNDIALELEGVPDAARAAHAAVALPADLAQAGSLTDGVYEVVLPSVEAVPARGWLMGSDMGEAYVVAGVPVLPPDDRMDAEAWGEALDGTGVVCTGVEDASAEGWEYKVLIEAAQAGAAGNDITLEADGASASVSGATLEDGADATVRTAADLVDAINDPDDPEVDFAFTAATEGTAASGSAVFNRAFTSARVTVSRGGTQLAQVTLSGFSSGVGGLATAINGNSTLAGLVHAASDGSTLTLAAAQSGAAANGTDVEVLAFSLPVLTRTITLAGGSGGSGLVLTAKEPGAAGNDVGVQASGCFGVAGQFSGGADASGYDYSLTPFSGGGGSEVRADYDGLLGQRAREVLPEGWLVERRSVEVDEGNLPPSCVVGVSCGANGGQVVRFVVPEGASPYQRGALVVDVDMERTAVPQVERVAWEYDPEAAREVARREVREYARRQNAAREDAQPWMLVKGAPLPPGWRIASGRVKMNVPHAKDAAKWQRFWAQFGAFKVLGRIESGIGFGVPYMFPVGAEDAYPPEDEPDFVEEKARLGKPLAPSILETSNVPANYRVMGPGENVHFLVEGSFPASSKAGANVGGLRFFKGCLKQYVFIEKGVSGISNEEALEFFKGSCLINGKQVRFTCLRLEAVFINRRRKRYQVGTNRQAPGDPDYDEDVDGGAGWHILGDRTEDDPEPQQGLTRADYIEAARAYLAACGNGGEPGRTEEVSARVPGGAFDAGLSVDDVFATLGMEPAASGGFSYDAGAHGVSARGSAGQAANFELDDFLTRRRAQKAQAWLDWKERHRDAEEAMEREGRRREDEPEQYPLTPQEVQEERERESYPMVSPGMSATAGVGNEDRPLNPFEVYADGDDWYMNEGSVIKGGGAVNFPTTQLPGSPKDYEFHLKCDYSRSQGKWVIRLISRPRGAS